MRVMNVIGMPCLIFDLNALRKSFAAWPSVSSAIWSVTEHAAMVEAPMVTMGRLNTSHITLRTKTSVSRVMNLYSLLSGLKKPAIEILLETYVLIP